MNCELPGLIQNEATPSVVLQLIIFASKSYSPILLLEPDKPFVCCNLLSITLYWKSILLLIK